MLEHGVSVHLRCRGETRSAKSMPERAPSAKDVAHRLVRLRAEAAGGATGGEGRYPQPRERVDDLGFDGRCRR
jgi:hypothetical protein